MKKNIFILLILSIIFSCNPVNDYNRGYISAQDTELGDKYILIREDTTFYRYLGSNNKRPIIQKGAIIQYHNPDGQIDTVMTWGGARVIDSHVNRDGIGDTFIIIEQKPLDSIFGKVINLPGNTCGREKKPALINDAKKKIYESEIILYWIINKYSDDIYGPYSHEQYLKQKEILKVPDNIKLDFIN